MSITDIADVMLFLEEEDDPFGNISFIYNGVEEYVKSYCNRDFDVTSYKEVISGVDSKLLLLKNYPIIGVDKFATTTITPLQIRNTNRFTTAVVSVTTIGLILKYNGEVSSGDFTFATNPTLSTLAASVNAAGSGWEAFIPNPDYGVFKSTELIENYGKNCIFNLYIDLQCFDSGEYDFYVDTTRGIIYLGDNFSLGYYNIYVNYTAGYETKPNDLIAAVNFWVKDLYTRHQENSIGLKNYSIGGFGGINKEFEEIPSNVKRTLDFYKKVLI